MPAKKKKEHATDKFDFRGFTRDLKKKFPETIYLLSDETESAALNPNRVGTGALNLDWAIGGGLPTGRIVEIYSRAESEGKTALAIACIKNAQQHGALCCFIDAERTTTFDRLKELGVNVENLTYAQPDNLEEGLKFVDDFAVKAREHGHTGDIVIVFDSIAAVEPQAQQKADYEANQFAVLARAMSQSLRKLNKSVSKSGSCVIMLNQSRKKINIMYGDDTETPGGKALKFHAAVRIELSKIRFIKQGDKEIGITVRARIKKNKVGPPFRTALLDINFWRGVDSVESVFRFALDNSVIVKDGKSYRVVGSKKKSGFLKSKFAEYLDEALVGKIEAAYLKELETVTVSKDDQEDPESIRDHDDEDDD